MPKAKARRLSTRAAIIVLLLLLIMMGHVWTPVGPAPVHAVHVLLRKLFILPIVLAAVWFGLRGAIIALVGCSLFYLPYVWLDWKGNVPENMNQYGEIVTFWITGVLAGAFVGREKAALRDVARTHEGALLALVNALDAREHDTQAHSLRVRSLSLRLGRALGLDSRRLRILSQGALLHDVGKIGIPDHILLKEGPLSSSEWDIMRKHPEFGQEILEAVPFLRQAAEIVATHHEKYDGTGYPRGLAGDQIPLGARIFAVVDVFDALTHERPYHEAVGFCEAKDTIRDSAGTHFDPQIAEAFLALDDSEIERVISENYLVSAQESLNVKR
ncbi:MAG: HD domain-containing protein [Candidatus Hydrogenedentes bacterium]|nr:HD domain-containing protein [Candidatus Hydrogenedentota bacterium]